MSSFPLFALATTIIPSTTPENRLRRRAKKDRVGGKRIAYNTTSCDLKQRKEGENRYGTTIDRRNVLLGFGGLYSGIASTIGTQKGGNMTAIAEPVQPPDITNCNLIPPGEDDPLFKDCCPPYSKIPDVTINDFVPPSRHEPLRVRKPAHMLTEEELNKFKEAIAKMKALAPDDPWNFYQQAKIHCTFCDEAYNQVNSKVPLQIHGSWLFLPWHRYYIYFWERILGKLIGDPTFTIPYWNYDNAEGMYMPEIYLDECSPLFNNNRNENHTHLLLDYQYHVKDGDIPGDINEVIACNYRYLAKNVYDREAIYYPSLFMGKPLRAGEQEHKDSSGTLERLHNTIHMWTGTCKAPYHDMGDFYTAARDPIFFGHHANVDRMWNIFSRMRNRKKESKNYIPEFNDRDWLDAAFIFYDENRNVVKVKVKDCLTTKQLRYTYYDSKILLDIERGKKFKCKIRNERTAEALKSSSVSEFGSNPRFLTEPIRAVVSRQKISRSKSDKEKEFEVLLIEGIEHQKGKPARFDIYVTAKGDDGDIGELAGSFVNVPHGHHKEEPSQASLELGITTLLEDINAEGSKELIVTLMPRSGDITVGGVRVELFPNDDGDIGYELEVD